MKADSPFNLLSPADMAKVADDACCYKANKHIPNNLLICFYCGNVYFNCVCFYITATTGTASVPFGLAKLVGGICFLFEA